MKQLLFFTIFLLISANGLTAPPLATAQSKSEQPTSWAATEPAATLAKAALAASTPHDGGAPLAQHVHNGDNRATLNSHQKSISLSEPTSHVLLATGITIMLLFRKGYRENER